MARFKKHSYVDDEKNIVTVLEITQTPDEFLQENMQVYNFSQTMKPGYKNEQTTPALTEEEIKRLSKDG